jgi:predicted amidohydrolase YtcJ
MLRHHFSYEVSMRTRIIRLTTTLILLGVPLSAQAQEPLADIVLHHGKILTVDKNFTIAEAVAIKGKEIIAVGSSEDVLKSAGPSTISIDLKGKTVTPGFVDTHRHIDREAEGAYGGAVAAGKKFDVNNAINLQRFPIDWRGIKTKADALAQVKTWMDRLKFKPGQWVYFVSENLSVSESSEQMRILYEDLNRWELDKVSPDNPIIFSMGIPENNGLLVNSKAIDWMFKEHGEFLRKNGHFWVDNGGRPEGHLESPATRFPQNFMYTRPAEVLAPIFKQHEEELVSMGITTTGSNMPRDSVAGYKLLESRGEQLLRIGYGEGQQFGNMTDLREMPQLKARVGTGSDLVWVNSITPGSMDGGSSRNCTSPVRHSEYAKVDKYWPGGQCYLDGEFRGAMGKGARISENYYKDWVLASGAAGVRFGNTHVAGDRSVKMLLNLVEQIQQKYGPQATATWSFDHCAFVDPGDFKRIAKLGIMMSCASKYIEERAATVSRTFDEKTAHTWVTPMKSMIDAGVKVVFESDRDIYFWEDMQRMQTRKDANGRVWGPDERLDRITAMRVATQWASDYMLRGDKLGSIEKGKWADLLVLDKDYMSIPTEQIATIQPQLTIVGGRVVFVHTAFADEYKLKTDGATISTYAELKKRRFNNRLGVFE